MNACTSCWLDFKSVGGFDAHRIFGGKKDDWKQRRCLTEKELRAKGYEPNDRKEWRIPMSEVAATALYGGIQPSKSLKGRKPPPTPRKGL